MRRPLQRCLLALVTAASVLALCSCGGGGGAGGTVAGRWRMMTVSYNGELYRCTEPGSQFRCDTTLTVNPDGTWELDNRVEDGLNSRGRGTWSLQGDTANIQVTETGEDANHDGIYQPDEISTDASTISFQYSVSGNTMTVRANFEEGPLVITGARL